MRIELVGGDVALADDLRLVRTSGHTSGHQSVIATTESGTELFIGDAAYTRAVWDHATATSKLPPGQAEDVEIWHQTLEGLRSRSPAKIHFCHDAT